MSKTYRAYHPDQSWLLPASLQEWLPADNLVNILVDFVDRLDPSAINGRYEQEWRGAPPYHPRLMLKVLLYGQCIGVTSSRHLVRQLLEDIGFRVLAANQTPDFRTIADFRRHHLVALGDLFLRISALGQRAGLVKLGHVALESKKVQANASKPQAMSYRRMQQNRVQLQQEVAAILR